jgi:hypothetical protein
MSSKNALNRHRRVLADLSLNGLRTSRSHAFEAPPSRKPTEVSLNNTCRVLPRASLQKQFHGEEPSMGSLNYARCVIPHLEDPLFFFAVPAVRNLCSRPDGPKHRLNSGRGAVQAACLHLTHEEPRKVPTTNAVQDTQSRTMLAVARVRSRNKSQKESLKAPCSVLLRSTQLSFFCCATAAG